MKCSGERKTSRSGWSTALLRGPWGMFKGM